MPFRISTKVNGESPYPKCSEHRWPVILLLMVFSLGINLFCAGCGESKSLHQSVSEWIGIDVPASAQVVEKINGYSSASFPIPGGLSDGYFHVLMQLSADEHQVMMDRITANMAGQPDRKWQEMPVRHNLLLIKNFLELSRIKPIPVEAEHGYYILIDRQSDDPDAIKADWTKRSSYNFTFAIYDDKERKLYLFLEDT